jgi:hypothetical protein
VYRCCHPLTTNVYWSLQKVDPLPVFLYVSIDVSYRVEVTLPLKRMFVGEFIITHFILGSDFHFHMQDEGYKLLGIFV